MDINLVYEIFCRLVSDPAKDNSKARFEAIQASRLLQVLLRFDQH